MNSRNSPYTRAACLSLIAFASVLGRGQQMSVPVHMLTAKTVIVRAWAPSSGQQVFSVQGDAERFLRKWKRYQIVEDVAQADLAVTIVVEPITVEPGFWKQAYFAWASSGTYGPGALLPPATVLSGSIIVYDGADMREFLHDSKSALSPIMVVLADSRGREPLTSAGNRLKKAVEAAAKKQGHN